MARIAVGVTNRRAFRVSAARIVWPRPSRSLASCGESTAAMAPLTPSTIRPRSRRNPDADPDADADADPDSDPGSRIPDPDPAPEPANENVLVNENDPDPDSALVST